MKKGKRQDVKQAKKGRPGISYRAAPNVRFMPGNALAK
jgi:hypothetical protein